ncbi:MAG: hypothetical protein IPJ65_16720 [Archangiaceae bacterium]|nr:hypothetical protein [Archangiaceae bacterium]
MIPLLVLAQAAADAQPSPGQVGSGRVIGGWEFVTAAYVLTFLGIVLYAASLWVRRPRS